MQIHGAVASLAFMILIGTGLPEPTPAQERICERPVFTPYTSPPELRNPHEAASRLRHHYPQDLEQRGIEGTVQLWVCIDRSGRVRKARVRDSSGHSELDRAALEAARQFEFRPAVNRNQRVSVWVVLPLTFDPSLLRYEPTPIRRDRFPSASHHFPPSLVTAVLTSRSSAR